jgi:hypothetical protein
LIETSIVPYPLERLCAPLLVPGRVQQCDTTIAIRQTEGAYVVLAVMVPATRYQHAQTRWWQSPDAACKAQGLAREVQ